MTQEFRNWLYERPWLSWPTIKVLKYRKYHAHGDDRYFYCAFDAHYNTLYESPYWDDIIRFAKANRLQIKPGWKTTSAQSGRAGEANQPHKGRGLAPIILDMHKQITALSGRAGEANKARPSFPELGQLIAEAREEAHGNTELRGCGYTHF